nr:hypothetical protein [Tanacetum cinerariifolium]
MSSSESAPTFAEFFEINELKAQVQEKDTVILKLKEKLKSFSGDVKERKTYKQLFDSIKSSCVQSKEQCDDLINKVNLNKAVLTEAVSLNPIDPALLQIDVAPLVPKLRKNRTAHIDYIRHTQEEAATLREIVKSERLLSPLNTSLAYALTPKNKTRQIRRVTLVSSASGSMSQDNTKKNRIRRTQKKAKKTELEDHLRTVKSSLNKESVVDSKATSSVIKSVSIVNSNLKCASCNGCLFSNNHVACVVAYINSVNARKKSKSMNTPVKRKVWKST